MITKVKIIIAIFIVTIFFLSCNSTKKSSNKKENNVVEKTKKTTTPKIAASYIVKELQGKKELAKNPTIVFHKGSISGNSGCNRYGGKVTITGNKIKFGALMGTKMYCEAFMKIEKEFLKALSNTDHYKIVENQILLFDKENVLLLVGEEK